MLASLDDINTFLPTDKLEARDGDERIARHQTDVDRVIKGYLSSTFSAVTLAAWADPDSTPGFIRSIAGRLIAAFHYGRSYTEDLPDWDRTYPQRIYNEAMQMLEQVRTGDVIVVEDETPSTQFSSNFFYPGKDSEPVFTMDMRF